MSSSSQGDHVMVDFHQSASTNSVVEQITLSWDDLTVKTTQSSGSICGRSKNRESKILANQFRGVMKPGELVAVMGASGAGKSTFMNALLFRNLSGLEVTGSRYLNGTAATPKSMTAVSAYIQQDDLFIGTLTPKEHLSFMAKVNMDPNLSKAEKKQRVESVIKDLGLTKCKDTLIGVPGRIKGISGGEKKRLAFATEVLTDPSLLFCDEPTSGLDSFMAANVAEVLK